MEAATVSSELRPLDVVLHRSRFRINQYTTTRRGAFLHTNILQANIEVPFIIV